MKRLELLFVIFLFPLIAIYGCGSGSGLSVSTGTGDGTTVAKAASLTISAKFPQNGKTGQIGTALIDQNTQCISVFVSGPNYYSAVLTPTNPSTTFTNVPVGGYWFDIVTYDGPASGGNCTGYVLDYLYSGGEVVEGQNTFVATLIRGGWQFVDANGDPVTLSLNGTMPTATEQLTGFSVIPSVYYYTAPAGLKKSSIDDTRPWASSEYPLLWKGLNLPVDYCGSTQTCQSWIAYFNQFIGPGTSNNAIEDGEIKLTPDPNYPQPCDPSGYCKSNRWAFFFGLPIDPTTTITDPNGNDMTPTVNAYATTMVTGADTIQGNLLEVLEKSSSGTEKCYDDTGASGVTPGAQIQCPWTSGTAKATMKEKAIMKALSEGIRKAQAQSCLIDLNWSGTDTWTEYWDLNNDGQPDPITVEETWSGSGDVCVHPFTAKGSQLPSTDIQLIVQKK